MESFRPDHSNYASEGTLLAVSYSRKQDDIALPSKARRIKMTEATTPKCLKSIREKNQSADTDELNLRPLLHVQLSGTSKEPPAQEESPPEDEIELPSPLEVYPEEEVA